jgi:hypothetical protein
MMNRKLIPLLAVSILVAHYLPQPVMAQNRNVKGKLVLFKTYPVANVEVTAKKSKNTVTSGADGYFYLECAQKDQINIKNRVFQPVNLRITEADDVFEINLIFKDTPKNRKLAVSMGYISEEDLLYGLNNLQYNNNDYCTYSDVFALIRGKFSDVEVRNIPGGGQGVYLRRGQKSLIEDTQTLYIVDGMRVENLSMVNPCEIKTIKVLKEGGAAIYGAGSRDGAVVIETK